MGKAGWKGKKRRRKMLKGNGGIGLAVWRKRRVVEDEVKGKMRNG